MITKIITENQTQIQEAIRTNGEGAITGAILQEKMLLLNGDLFGGQIEYSNHILLADVERSVNNSVLYTGTELFNFFKEWYDGAKMDWGAGRFGELQGTYIALYGGLNLQDIVGYMHLVMTWGALGTDEIGVTLMGSTSEILYFQIRPDSDNFNSAQILSDLTIYRRAPRYLVIYTPEQQTTTYASRAELCEGLGITEAQLSDLQAGRYAGLRTTYHFMPIVVIGQESGAFSIIAGYFSVDELGARIQIMTSDAINVVLYTDYDLH